MLDIFTEKNGYNYSPFNQCMVYKLKSISCVPKTGPVAFNSIHGTTATSFVKQFNMQVLYTYEYLHMIVN